MKSLPPAGGPGTDRSAPEAPAPVRVLFVVESYSASPKVLGGVEVTLRSLVAGLAESGVAVLVPEPVLLPLPRYRAERAKLARARRDPQPPPPGVRVLRPRFLHLPWIWGITDPPQILALCLWAAWFRVGRVDVVHGHRLHPMGAVAVMLARLLRRPSVVSVYGYGVHTAAHHGPWAVRFWSRFALRHATRVVGVSRSLLAGAEALGAPAERLRFVPSGVALDEFVPQDQTAVRRRLGLPPDRRVLLCPSHFVAVKGHEVLVAAFRLLSARRDDVLLVLTSEGPLRARIETAVRDAGLADRVRFPGLLKREELTAYVAASDLVVLPSHNEGMPLCVIEGLACARPAVATAVGGTPEVVSDSRYGLLVAPGNPEALAEALAEALSRPWDAAALRRRAEEFGWPRVIAGLRAVYAEVAGG